MRKFLLPLFAMLLAFPAAAQEDAGYTGFHVPGNLGFTSGGVDIDHVFGENVVDAEVITGTPDTLRLTVQREAGCAAPTYACSNETVDFTASPADGNSFATGVALSRAGDNISINITGNAGFTNLTDTVALAPESHVGSATVSGTTLTLHRTDGNTVTATGDLPIVTGGSVTGTTLTLNRNQGLGNIAIPGLPSGGGGSSISLRDETTDLTDSLLDLTFTGAGVECTEPGAADHVTCTITGGSGGGGAADGVVTAGTIAGQTLTLDRSVGADVVITGLPVPFSGAYGDLTGRPTIPAAPASWAVTGNTTIVPQEKLGTGTQDGSRYLRDDGTWQPVVVSGSATGITRTALLTDFAVVAATTFAEMTLSQNLADGFILEFDVDGTGSGPGAIGYIGTDALLDLTAHSSAPTGTALASCTAIKIHNPGDNNFGHESIQLCNSDEANKVWIQFGRDGAETLTITRLEFARGAQGVQGQQGTAGATGAAGSDGAAGMAGAAGMDGATGATGPAGPAGADGAVGATTFTALTDTPSGITASQCVAGNTAGTALVFSACGTGGGTADGRLHAVTVAEDGQPTFDLTIGDDVVVTGGGRFAEPVVEPNAMGQLRAAVAADEGRLAIDHQNLRIATREVVGTVRPQVTFVDYTAASFRGIRSYCAGTPNPADGNRCYSTVNGAWYRYAQDHWTNFAASPVGWRGAAATEADAEHAITAIGQIAFIIPTSRMVFVTAYTPGSTVYEYHWEPEQERQELLTRPVLPDPASTNVGQFARVNAAGTAYETAAVAAPVEEVVWVSAADVDLINANFYRFTGTAAATDGQIYVFEAEATNTGPVTVVINSLNYGLVKAAESGTFEALEGGELANGIVTQATFYEGALYWTGTLLGSAARRDVGLDEFELVALGTGGAFPTRTIAPAGANRQVLTRTTTGHEWADDASVRHTEASGFPHFSPAFVAQLAADDQGRVYAARDEVVTFTTAASFNPTLTADVSWPGVWRGVYTGNPPSSNQGDFWWRNRLNSWEQRQTIDEVGPAPQVGWDEINQLFRLTPTLRTGMPTGLFSTGDSVPFSEFVYCAQIACANDAEAARFVSLRNVNTTNTSVVWFVGDPATPGSWTLRYARAGGYIPPVTTTNTALHWSGPIGDGQITDATVNTASGEFTITRSQGSDIVIPNLQDGVVTGVVVDANSGDVTFTRSSDLPDLTVADLHNPTLVGGTYNSPGGSLRLDLSRGNDVVIPGFFAIPHPIPANSWSFPLYDPTTNAITWQSGTLRGAWRNDRNYPAEDIAHNDGDHWISLQPSFGSSFEPSHSTGAYWDHLTSNMDYRGDAQATGHYRVGQVTHSSGEYWLRTGSDGVGGPQQAPSQWHRISGGTGVGGSCTIRNTIKIAPANLNRELRFTNDTRARQNVIQAPSRAQRVQSAVQIFVNMHFSTLDTDRMDDAGVRYWIYADDTLLSGPHDEYLNLGSTSGVGLNLAGDTEAIDYYRFSTSAVATWTATKSTSDTVYRVQVQAIKDATLSIHGTSVESKPINLEHYSVVVNDYSHYNQSCGGGVGVPVHDEGTPRVTNPDALNFVGPGVTVTDTTGTATITIPGGGSVPVREEGTQVIAAPSAYNFVGAGVTASASGTVATITIPGGTGGGGTGDIFAGLTDALPADTDTFIFRDVSAGTTNRSIEWDELETIATPDIRDDGTLRSNRPNSIDFTGGGITCTSTDGRAVTCAVPGGDFDLHDDVTQTFPMRAGARVLFSAEDRAGDPNAYLPVEDFVDDVFELLGARTDVTSVDNLDEFLMWDVGGAQVRPVPATVLRTYFQTGITGAADGVVTAGTVSGTTLTLDRSVGADVVITGLPSGGGGGTTVVANPTEAGTVDLTKLQVGTTVYTIPAGGGGAAGLTFTLLGTWTQTLTADQDQYRLFDSEIALPGTDDSHYVTMKDTSNDGDSMAMMVVLAALPTATTDPNAWSSGYNGVARSNNTANEYAVGQNRGVVIGRDADGTYTVGGQLAATYTFTVYNVTAAGGGEGGGTGLITAINPGGSPRLGISTWTSGGVDYGTSIKIEEENNPRGNFVQILDFEGDDFDLTTTPPTERGETTILIAPAITRDAELSPFALIGSNPNLSNFYRGVSFTEATSTLRLIEADGGIDDVDLSALAGGGGGDADGVVSGATLASGTLTLTRTVGADLTATGFNNPFAGAAAQVGGQPAGDLFLIYDSSAGVPVTRTPLQLADTFTPEVREEGTRVAQFGAVFDFVGAGVTATGTGAVATITIPGAGVGPAGPAGADGADGTDGATGPAGAAGADGADGAAGTAITANPTNSPASNQLSTIQIGDVKWNVNDASIVPNTSAAHSSALTNLQIHNSTYGIVPNIQNLGTSPGTSIGGTTEFVVRENPGSNLNSDRRMTAATVRAYMSPVAERVPTTGTTGHVLTKTATGSEFAAAAGGGGGGFTTTNVGSVAARLNNSDNSRYVATGITGWATCTWILFNAGRTDLNSGHRMMDIWIDVSVLLAVTAANDNDTHSTNNAVVWPDPRSSGFVRNGYLGRTAANELLYQGGTGNASAGMTVKGIGC